MPETTPAAWRATASVPGKLILMGEHAAVYGYPALVAAIDLRLTAALRGPEPERPERVHLAVPALTVDSRVPWQEIVAYTQAARERWESWFSAPRRTPFVSPQQDSAGHLARIALGEAAAFLGESHGPSISARVETRLPVGAGFGSSAAAAVALVAGYLALRSAPAGLAEIERIALEVERRQHGTPSGIDGATVIHGGILWTEPAEGRRAACELRSPALEHLRIFQTGAPAESTGTVVAAVREHVAAAPQASHRVFEIIREATEGLRRELASNSEDGALLCQLITACQRALEELGVVPAPVRALVRAIEAQGGAAKISGAGALSGTAAGCLLVYHPDPARLAGWDGLSHLTPYPVALGAPGLEVQRQEIAP
ncbi:MAG: hypothetical protein AAF604_08535 [Acidobacteriota bacterium]